MEPRAQTSLGVSQRIRKKQTTFNATLKMHKRVFDLEKYEITKEILQFKSLCSSFQG